MGMNQVFCMYLIFVAIGGTFRLFDCTPGMACDREGISGLLRGPVPS